MRTTLQTMSVFVADFVKIKKGSLKIDFNCDKEVDLYFINETGFEMFKESKSIGRENLIFQNKCSVLNHQIDDLKGRYYLLIHNKNEESVEIELELSENQNPPIMVGLLGSIYE